MQEIWECDSNSAFTIPPSAAETPLFMFLTKKNAKKGQCQFRWRLISAPWKMLWLCARIWIFEDKIHFVVAHEVSLATSEGSDLWSVYCVVASYSHGSLTDFYEIFESVASNIPSHNISQDTSFFSGLLTMVALLVTVTPRTLSTLLCRKTLENTAQENTWNVFGCHMRSPLVFQECVQFRETRSSQTEWE